VTGLAAVLLFAAATRVLGSASYGTWPGSLVAGPIVLGAVLACSAAEEIAADRASGVAWPAGVQAGAPSDVCQSGRPPRACVARATVREAMGAWRGVAAPPVA
jgi:hypothetical protein